MILYSSFSRKLKWRVPHLVVGQHCSKIHFVVSQTQQVNPRNFCSYSYCVAVRARCELYYLLVSGVTGYFLMLRLFWLQQHTSNAPQYTGSAPVHYCTFFEQRYWSASRLQILAREQAYELASLHTPGKHNPRKQLINRRAYANRLVIYNMRFVRGTRILARFDDIGRRCNTLFYFIIDLLLFIK